MILHTCFCTLHNVLILTPCFLKIYKVVTLISMKVENLKTLHVLHKMLF